MNEVTVFLVVTASIFAVITALLPVMSRLESTLTDQDTDDGPPSGD